MLYKKYSVMSLKVDNQMSTFLISLFFFCCSQYNNIGLMSSKSLSTWGDSLIVKSQSFLDSTQHNMCAYLIHMFASQKSRLRDARSVLNAFSVSNPSMSPCLTKTNWVSWSSFFLFISKQTIKAFVSANHGSYLTPATVNMVVFKKDSPNSQHRVV